MSISLEQRISNLEYILSSAAIVPVIGIIPAAVKLILSIIQAVCGLLVALVTLPFACCSDSAKKISLKGLSHFVNGVANMIGAVLEAIPFAGTVIVVGRWRRTYGPQIMEAVHGELKEQRHMICVGYQNLSDPDDLASPLISI